MEKEGKTILKAVVTVASICISLVYLVPLIAQSAMAWDRWLTKALGN